MDEPAVQAGLGLLDFETLLFNFSDSGIVYSPGGNFVLSIFAYHPVQIVFDEANLLFANLGDAAYNFYNLPTQ